MKACPLALYALSRKRFSRIYILAGPQKSINIKLAISKTNAISSILDRTEYRIKTASSESAIIRISCKLFFVMSINYPPEV
jgi:hypothetical protein